MKKRSTNGLISCIFLFALGLLRSQTVSAEPPRPDMSAPIPIQVEADSVLNPNMIGFFEHPLTGDENFNSADFKVKLPGVEGEFDVQDYFVVQGATKTGECNLQTDAIDSLWLAWVNYFQSFTAKPLGISGGVALFALDVAMCPTKDALGAVMLLQVASKAMDKASFDTLVDTVKTNYKSMSSDQFADYVKNELINEIYKKSPELIDQAKTALDQLPVPAKKASLSDLLLADVRSIDGDKNINSAEYLDPYKNGYSVSLGEFATAVSVVAESAKPELSKASFATTKPIGGIVSVVTNDLLKVFNPQGGQANFAPTLAYYKLGDTLKIHSFGGVFSNVEKCKPDPVTGKSPCAPDEQATAIASSDLDGDGCDDLVVASRKTGGLSTKAHANVYLGTCDDSADGTFPFKYVGTADVGPEPYDASPIDGDSVIVTANKPSDDGKYYVYKIAYDGKDVISTPIEVEVPIDGYGPYQVTSVDLKEICANDAAAKQGFALTWARLTDPITLYYQFSVFTGCDHSLLGHYEATTLENTTEGTDTFTVGMLSGIAFAPEIPSTGSPAGIWVGDQRIYKLKPNRVAAAYFYPIENAKLAFSKTYTVATEEMLGHLTTTKSEDGGGVKQLRVDKFGNLGVVLGYPKVLGDAVVAKAKEQCACIPNGKKEDYASYSPGCFNLTLGGDLANKNGIPDSCEVSCETVSKGEFAHKDKKGNNCYMNDTDCDGKADYIITKGSPLGTNIAVKCDVCPGVPPDKMAQGLHNCLTSQGQAFGDKCYLYCKGPENNAGEDPCYNPSQEDICSEIPSSPPPPVVVEFCKEGSTKDGMVAITGKSKDANGCSISNDADCDGVPDYFMKKICVPGSKCTYTTTEIPCDNCPPPKDCTGEACKSTKNPDQADIDKDGIGDVCVNLPIVDYDEDGLVYDKDPCECNYPTWPFKLDTGVNIVIIPLTKEAKVGSFWMMVTGKEAMLLDIDLFDNDYPSCYQQENFWIDGKCSKTGLYMCTDPDKDKICSQRLANYMGVATGIVFDALPKADLDNCPFLSNPGQNDSNNNEIGDECEGDIDGDSVNDDVDNCPFVANPDQKYTPESKGKFGIACATKNIFWFNKKCKTSVGEIVPATGVDSDGDKIDDACDPMTLPKGHVYWDAWETKLQSSLKKPFSLISEAYAAEEAPPAVPEQPKNRGQVTVLINKSFKVEKPLPPLATSSDCGVTIGGGGYEAAGIGGLNSPYDNYIRDLNTKIRKMYQSAIKAKTGVERPLESINVDVFAGENGYYKANCSLKSPNAMPAWVMYQLGGMPLDPKNFGKDNVRPAFPPKEVEVTLANGQSMTISRDDFLKNIAVRLLTTKNTDGVAKSMVVVPNTASIEDFITPSIVANRLQLLMLDTNASTQIVGNDEDAKLAISIGPQKETPLMNIVVSSDPLVTTGSLMNYELNGRVGYDGGGWSHPDLVAPPPSVRAMNPNDVLSAIKSALEQVVSDTSVSDVTYKDVMTRANIQWDNTGFLNMKFLVSEGESSPVINILIDPISNVSAAESGGCHCNFNDAPVSKTQAMLPYLALVFLGVVLRIRRKRL